MTSYEDSLQCRACDIAQAGEQNAGARCPAHPANEGAN